jgi:hypothetical protein
VYTRVSTVPENLSAGLEQFRAYWHEGVRRRGSGDRGADEANKSAARRFANAHKKIDLK